MLTDQDLQLLTAFVDGELPDRQREGLLRLLHESSEARAFLRDFQENVHSVGQLPLVKLDPGFADQLLQAISEQGQGSAPAVQAGSTTASRSLPLWASMAMAAAVLLAMVGAYLWFSPANQPFPGPIVENPQPRPTPRKGLKLDFKDLAQEEKQHLLAKELKKEPAVYLDLQVQDQQQAVARLQEALGGNGIELMVDTQTKKNMQQGEKSQYLVYAENIRPEELVSLMQKLGESQAATFDHLVVSAMTGDDREHLSKLLGIQENNLGMPPREDPFATLIIPKEKAKNAANSKAPKALPRLALVLAQEPGRANSPEVQAFLAGRKELHPGTLQVLLVLQQA